MNQNYKKLAITTDPNTTYIVRDGQYSFIENYAWVKTMFGHYGDDVHPTDYGCFITNLNPGKCQDTFNIPRFLVREWDHTDWYEITIIEWQQREDQAGPNNSAFAEVRFSK